MIPRKRIEDFQKKAVDPIEPLKLVEIEVEEIEIQMGDAIKLYYLLKEGDSCRADDATHSIVLIIGSERISVNPDHVYWMSRRKRVIKVPESPYIPPASLPTSTP